MNRSILRTVSLLFSFCFILAVGQAQEVQEKQMSLVVKKTATWCPNCGSWGWEWFKDLINETEDQAFCIALHSTSSDLKPPNDLDGALLAQFSGNGGFPTFFVNGVAGSSLSGLMTAVSEAAELSPVAGIGMLTGFQEEDITVQGRVEFFQPYQGEIFVGYYIIEDSLVHSQSAQGSNAVHRNVLLNAIEGNPFGNSMTVDVQAGESLIFPGVQSFPSLAIDRSYILGVIWTYANGKYTYLNSWMEPIANGPISALSPSDVLAGSQLFPNPVPAGTSLQLVLPNELTGQIDMRILHLDGRIIQRMSCTIQDHQVRVSVPASLVTGSYFLRVTQGDATHTFPMSVTQ
ncbi:MAG: T9SS type A sorting domain-containing protein [Saprospiraceae bacterium]|nr:T9SS type A sorting domain-containing protein [Saprospiraceae bacterium]